MAGLRASEMKPKAFRLPKHVRRLQRSDLYRHHRDGTKPTPEQICSAVGIYGDEHEHRCAGNLSRGQAWLVISKRLRPSTFPAWSHASDENKRLCREYSDRYSLPSAWIDYMHHGDEREDRPQHEDRVASVWGIVGRFARWVGGR